jgi:hypothetical protein
MALLPLAPPGRGRGPCRVHLDHSTAPTPLPPSHALRAHGRGEGLLADRTQGGGPSRWRGTGLALGYYLPPLRGFRLRRGYGGQVGTPRSAPVPGRVVVLATCARPCPTLLIAPSSLADIAPNPLACSSVLWSRHSEAQFSPGPGSGKVQIRGRGPRGRTGQYRHGAGTPPLGGSARAA